MFIVKYATNVIRNVWYKKGFNWAYCSIFENGRLLIYTLEGVNSVGNFIIADKESH